MIVTNVREVELRLLARALTDRQHLTLQAQNSGRLAAKLARVTGAWVVLQSGAEADRAGRNSGALTFVGVHSLDIKLRGHRPPFLVFDNTIHRPIPEFYQGGSLWITDRLFRELSRLHAFTKPNISCPWAITDTLTDIVTILKAEGFYADHPLGPAGLGSPDGESPPRQTDPGGSDA